MGCEWADIVLTAAEAGLPLLFIEADNCAEEAPIIAAKFDTRRSCSPSTRSASGPRGRR